MIDRLLAQFEPRVILLLLAGGLVITVLGAYAWFFKLDIAEFDRLHQARSESQRDFEAERDRANDERIGALENKIEALRNTLYGNGVDLPGSQMVSYIITQLDRLSVLHGVRLVSVNPGETGEVLAFSEVPFDVEVAGRYLNLYAWLEDAERELRPLVVKQFLLEPRPETDGLRMNLRLVSYRARGSS